MTINAEMVDNLLFTALCYYIEDFARVDASKTTAEMAAKASEYEVMARTALERAADVQKAIDRLEERYILGKLSEQKAESLRQSLEAERQTHTRTAEDATARHAQTIAEIERVKSGENIDMFDLSDRERAEEIRKYVDEYCRLFGIDPVELMDSPFTVVTPDSANPYKQLYVAN
jgi:hypothetical protein